MRRPIALYLLLALLVAVTAPPLALLCRGRSPSRFSPVNLPVWERRAPAPLRAKAVLRARPLPPNDVQFSAILVQPLARANEGRLLAQMEAPPRAPTAAAGLAGDWLVSACALGRHSRALTAKQDRIALRLMTAEDADGYLAAGQGRRRWTGVQVAVTARNLRGLLAYYGASHHAAAIYAAMQAGDLVASTAELTAAKSVPIAANNAPTPRAPSVPPPTAAALVLPMVRLSLMSGQARYLQWALHQAKVGRADTAGLCALYLATARPGFLHQAQALWQQHAAHGQADIDGAACLYAVTGAPGYVRVLRRLPVPWACPLAAGSLACTQTPHGLSVNVWTTARFVWHGVQWTQTTINTANGNTQTTLAVLGKPAPAKPVLPISVSFPLAGHVTAALNSKPLTIAPGHAMLTLARPWLPSDRAVLTLWPAPPAAAAHSPTPPRKSPSP